MSVNQMLLPDALADLLKEKQREGFYGEISVSIAKGEVQTVTVGTRPKLEDLVRDHVFRKQRLVVVKKKFIEPNPKRESSDRPSEANTTIETNAEPVESTKRIELT